MRTPFGGSCCCETTRPCGCDCCYDSWFLQQERGGSDWIEQWYFATPNSRHWWWWWMQSLVPPRSVSDVAVVQDWIVRMVDVVVVVVVGGDGQKAPRQ